MEARIWGCRGSLATPGPATVGYGGNTTCVEVRAESGSVIVLDAGTGIRDLGRLLEREQVRDFDLLLTHLHLDHIEGLGFLAPLFDDRCTVRIHGPRPAEASLADTIAGYLSPPFFPVPFDRFGADISFFEVERDGWDLNGVRVSSVPVRHPGPTLGYRLAENGRSLAFVPDNEPGLDPGSGLDVAGGADLLLHDAQYSDDEYAGRVGWGHTSTSGFVRYLADAAPARAVMVHHDPTHDDARLEELLAATRAASGRDGDALTLGRESGDFQQI